MIQQQLKVLCPTCGHSCWPDFTLPTPGTVVTLALCPSQRGGCGTQFAVEVQVTIAIEVYTCRLTLPSTHNPDALVGLEPKDARAF